MLGLGLTSHAVIYQNVTYMSNPAYFFDLTCIPASTYSESSTPEAFSPYLSPRLDIMGSGYIATSNIIFDPYIWCTVHPHKSGNFQHAHMIFFGGFHLRFQGLIHSHIESPHNSGTSNRLMGPHCQKWDRPWSHVAAGLSMHIRKNASWRCPTYSNISFLTSNCLLSVVLASDTLVWKLQGPGSSQGYQPHDPMSPKWYNNNS